MLLDPLVAVPDILAYATVALLLPEDIVGVLAHVLKNGFENEPLEEIVTHIPEEYLNLPVTLIVNIIIERSL